MLRDVRSNVTDGLLGFATATGDGLHIKIGVSPSVTEKPITILGSMGASTIKSKLGLSPLADAVMDAVQGGAARVFCIPVAASTAGTIGEVTKTGDGGGSVTVQGSPNNAYALTVRFTAQGSTPQPSSTPSTATTSRMRSPSPSLAATRSRARA